jgi:hypothetical protein
LLAQVSFVASPCAIRLSQHALPFLPVLIAILVTYPVIKKNTVERTIFELTVILLTEGAKRKILTQQNRTSWR